MRSILITGASSGIGAALARAYAGPGIILALGGRDVARLEAVADACRGQGATVATRVVDVADAESMTAWLEATDAAAPLDLVVANAGISAGTGGGGESAEQTRAIFAVNVNGVLNTVLPVIPSMRARRRGQIAIVSSIAGYRGLPPSPAYSGSKAAVKVWGEGLRGWLANDGIEVSVVCPGYIKTPMTAVNDFPMPFLMDADKAAAIIRTGLERNRGRIAFPWPMAALIWLVTALPVSLTDPFLRRLPAKRARPSTPTAE